MGQSKKAALRSSKLAFINEDQYKAYQHPFYWAGFIMFGAVE